MIFGADASVRSYVDGAEQVSTKNMLVSELGSLSLEFTKLSQLTGDMRFYDAVQRIANELEKAQSKTRLPGMWPIVVDARNLTFDMDNSFTLGGMSDSAYEYLPKQYLLLGGRLEQPRRLYEAFLPVAKRHLFRRAMNEHNRTIVLSGDARVVGELSDPSVISTPQMQHLTCFVGGMVALAARALDRGQDEIELARALTDGCVWSYEATSSGVGPETFNYIACADIDDPDADAKCAWDEMRWRRAVGARWKPFAKAVPGEVHRRNDAPTPTVEDGGAGNNGTDGNAQHAPAATDDEISRIIKTKRLPPGMTNVPGPEYLLRPEAIESVFIMHRVTGEPEWMEKAWRMFERVEATTRTKWAAAALNDVTRPNPSHINNMQSFWLTETLKYFYLVFADWDVVDLDEWVLNTEAHPFRRADAMG